MRLDISLLLPVNDVKSNIYQFLWQVQTIFTNLDALPCNNI